MDYAQKKTARIAWIDIAKYICIMCVVMIHMESCTEVLRIFFSPFYLSLFFFLSGYVYKTINFKIFTSKKIKQLLVPWFIFSMLNILFTFIMNGSTEEYAEKHGSLLENIGWNFLQIRGIDDGMWFVAALFVAFIPFYFFIKKYDNSICKNKTAYLLSISFVLSLVSLIYSTYGDPGWFPWKSTALPWHLEYIFQAMFFMVLGYIFKRQIEKIYDNYNTIGIRVVLTLVYMLLVYSHVVVNYISNPIMYLLYNYVCALLGIVVIVAWCKVLPSNKYVLYIGRNTLIIFGLHNYVFRIIEKILESKLYLVYKMILGNELISTVFVLIFAFVVSVILIIPTYIIEKYFPWVVGRKK